MRYDLRTLQPIPHRRQRKGVVHVLAHCTECEWKNSNYRTGVDAARRHHQTTGHRVEGEIASAFYYGDPVTAS